jgi:hypothetical protein
MSVGIAIAWLCQTSRTLPPMEELQESIARFCALPPDDPHAPEALRTALGQLEALAATGLPRLVELLGPFLTNPEDSCGRVRATELLASSIPLLVPHAPSEHLTAVLSFFMDRVGDFSAALQSLQGLEALVHTGRLDGPSLVGVCLAPLRELHVPSLDRPRRQAVFRLLELCLSLEATHEALDAGSSWEELLVGYLSSMDGERDPRCLAACLPLLARMLSLIERRGAVAEGCEEHGLYREAFDISAVYFPLTFRPPPNDPHKITRQQLTQGLEFIFSSTARFAPMVLPMLIERLSAPAEGPSDLMDMQRTDSACALQTTVPAYGLPKIKPYLSSLSACLFDRVSSSPSAGQALHSLVRRLLESFGRSKLGGTLNREGAWSSAAPAPPSSTIKPDDVASRAASARAVAGESKGSRIPPALLTALAASGAIQGVVEALSSPSVAKTESDWTLECLVAIQTISRVISRSVELTGDRTPWDAFVEPMATSALRDLRSSPDALHGRASAAILIALASASALACRAIASAALPEILAACDRESTSAEHCSAMIVFVASLVSVATVVAPSDAGGEEGLALEASVVDCLGGVTHAHSAVQWLTSTASAHRIAFPFEEVSILSRTLGTEAVAAAAVSLSSLASRCALSTTKFTETIVVIARALISGAIHWKQAASATVCSHALSALESAAHVSFLAHTDLSSPVVYAAVKRLSSDDTLSSARALDCLTEFGGASPGALRAMLPLLTKAASCAVDQSPSFSAMHKLLKTAVASSDASLHALAFETSPEGHSCSGLALAALHKCLLGEDKADPRHAALVLQTVLSSSVGSEAVTTLAQTVWDLVFAPTTGVLATLTVVTDSRQLDAARETIALLNTTVPHLQSASIDFAAVVKTSAEVLMSLGHDRPLAHTLAKTLGGLVNRTLPLGEAERLVAEFATSGTEAESSLRLLVVSTLCKAVLMRGSRKIDHVVLAMLGRLESDEGLLIGRALASLTALEDEQSPLSATQGAALRPLYRQRVAHLVLQTLCPSMEPATLARLSRHQRATACLVVARLPASLRRQYLPVVLEGAIREVSGVFDHPEWLPPPPLRRSRLQGQAAALAAATHPHGTGDDREDSARAVSGALSILSDSLSAPPPESLSVTKLAPALSCIARAHPDHNSRISALQCLMALKALPHATLFPIKAAVVSRLRDCLDDDVREVRQAAVSCRGAWMSTLK